MRLQQLTRLTHRNKSTAEIILQMHTKSTMARHQTKTQPMNRNIIILKKISL